MAQYFSMQAECGAEDDAAAVAAHFTGFPLILSDGLTIACEAMPWRDVEGNWWAGAAPPGASAGAPSGDDPELRKASRMSEIGHLLYARLKTAPRFRYALCAVEASEFRYFSEIDADLVERDFHGLVVSERIWEALGRATVFVPFREGYYWRPYRGEDRDL